MVSTTGVLLLPEMAVPEIAESRRDLVRGVLGGAPEFVEGVGGQAEGGAVDAHRGDGFASGAAYGGGDGV